MSNRKIAFIVNPVSGTGDKKKIIKKIQSTAWLADEDIEIYYTQYAGDAFESTKKYVAKGFDIVVAVGGDGTVNEIASALIHTDTALCIIPIGSGNGLARDLHIPLKISDAVNLLQKSKTANIDVCYFNDKPYFCTAGVGYDAAVGKIFTESRRRGFLSYVVSSLKVYLKIKPAKYRLTIDGDQITQNAFDVTFANASQFGNNAYIAPLADLSDGFIDVVVVRSFPWYKSAAIGVRLFMKNLHKSQYVKIYKCKNVVLERPSADCAHIDGESITADKRIEIKIEPSALKVLVK
jgi:YegS/Rv2252/BmrU family lipid kinase